MSHAERLNYESQGRKMKANITSPYIKDEGAGSERMELPAPRYWKRVVRHLLRDPVTIGCTLIIVAVVGAAIAAPFIAPANPFEASMMNRLQPIGSEGYLLGTDRLGRDILSRLLYGGRVSLIMGIAPVLLAVLIGGGMGILAGYAGGFMNTVIMRTMDVFYAFPSILLAIAIAGAMGPGISNGIIALTLVFIPPMTRVAESAATQIRKHDYIEAARAATSSHYRVLRVHVVGNVVGTILVYATSLVSLSIIIASGLSFLGLGVSPPNPEWGLMLSDLRESIYFNPWVAVLPGLMIFVTSVSFNLLSDGLRSAMDIRL
ncbi:ABC transporter permease [Halomonas sp. TA6]|nr:ABC transporter permease [Halomonas sp. TA6]